MRDYLHPSSIYPNGRNTVFKWGISSIFNAKLILLYVIYHDKIELFHYTFIRYWAVFIFIWECTRLLPNEIYSISVKHIFDYKVHFLRYTRTYSLNGCGRRGMICCFNSLNDLVSFFVSFLSLHILFRFVSQFSGTQIEHVLFETAWIRLSYILT